MAALDKLMQNKIFSIRNLLMLVTAILMTFVIVLTALRMLAATDNSDRAERAQKINELVDHMSDLKLALAAERSATYAGYGISGNVDRALVTMIGESRGSAQEAYGNIVADLENLPAFDGEQQNEAIYKIVNQEFNASKTAFLAAFNEYRDNTSQIDADMRTFADNRELSSRGATKPMTDLIEATGTIRGIIEESYDFGDDRIAQVMRLKHQLWLMIEYATREAASLGLYVASGSEIAETAKTLGSQYNGGGQAAWEQVKAIAGSTSLANENTTRNQREKQIADIQEIFFDDFEATRFELYDMSDEAEMNDDGDMIADYGMTPLEWVNKANAAKAPVNDMASYAGRLSAQLNEDAVSKATADLTTAVILLLVVAGIGVLAFWVVFYRVVKPVNALSDTMMVLSQGELEVDVPSIESQDEVGDMARSVQVFKENAIERKNLEAEQREREETERKRAEEEAKRQREEAEERRARDQIREEKARGERRQAMLDLADQFEASVMKVVEGVSNSASEMEGAARGMAGTADDTSKKSEVVANAAGQASSNAQMVASAAEELSSSVREITGQTNQSSEAARDAVARTENAGKDVAELEEAAQKIGDVVKLINDIAEQTNLLALNATIEAARAGDAGRGFAVVASEVKSLANQTAKATQEISDQVEGMQHATTTAVRAMDDIKGIISDIESTSVSIASAVEEQDASTQEIARNVAEVSTGTEEVTSNIHAVNQGATSTGSAATEVLSAAQLLTQQSDELRGQVEGFLKTVREQ